MFGKRFWLVFSLLYLLIGIGAAPVVLAKDTPSDTRLLKVRQAIQGAKARWKAASNPISRLSRDAQRKLLGWIPSPTSDLYSSDAELLDETSYTATLPTRFDWRNVGGTNYITSVKRQRCGDCWAFAAIGALEARLAIDGTSNEDLSEQLLVSSCCNTGSCSGGYIVSTSRFIRDTGSPDEGCYPYLGRDSSCNQACGNWREVTRMVNSYTRVSQTVASLKSALYTRGPINVGMMVYTDFSYYSSGIYQYTYGQQEGGHAVLIVGYDDDQEYFIVKNSWGSDWGENGFFRIAYSQVDSGVDFGAEACVYGDEIDHGDDPTPDPEPEPDNELDNGEVVNDLSGSRGQWQYFTIKIPAGASDLRIKISGGSGDADLYVNAGSQPTRSDYDCRPYRWGNNEQCTISTPTAGTYHIGLYGYRVFSGVDLDASYLIDNAGIAKPSPGLASGPPIPSPQLQAAFSTD
jgi:C1A family cysteine protease